MTRINRAADLADLAIDAVCDADHFFCTTEENEAGDLGVIYGVQFDPGESPATVEQMLALQDTPEMEDVLDALADWAVNQACDHCGYCLDSLTAEKTHLAPDGFRFEVTAILDTSE